MSNTTFDFTYASIEKLEDRFAKTFPNEECAVSSFHLELLCLTPFRLMAHGWTKEELLEFFTDKLDYARDTLAEFEKEELEA